MHRDISAIEQALHYITMLSEQYHVHPEDLFHCKLSTEELIYNIQTYGCPDKDRTPSIKFSVTIEENTMIMSLIDDGIPFNPVAFDEKSFEEKLSENITGGFGIMIFKKLTDKTTYTRENDENHLVIEKKLRFITP